MLGQKLKEKDPDEIIISSPHLGWGFDVPLFFLAKEFKKKNVAGAIRTYLAISGEPHDFFQEGERISEKLEDGKKYALIASGDLSHHLLESGPYGFKADGPKFDHDLMTSLKERKTENILKLDEKYPEAGECGLRPISFILGFLNKVNYETEILSYEFPFGVGYLVANFTIL